MTLILPGLGRNLRPENCQGKSSIEKRGTMRTLAVIFCLCLFAALAFSQAASGTITGTILDPAGAVVANATVEVKNNETGQAVATVSTATGSYTATNLPPGPYAITVSVAGFKKST